MDGRLRSIAKAFSWRIIATLTTATVAFIVSGRVDVAAEIGALDALLKLALYYAHERFWNRHHREQVVASSQ